MGLAKTLFAVGVIFASAAAFAAESSLPNLGNDIDGVWAGSLTDAGMDLTLAFAIKTTGDKSSVLLRIPEPAADTIAVSAASRDGAKLKFDVKDINGSFEGALNNDQSAIAGTWVQMGKRIPLTLKRRTR